MQTNQTLHCWVGYDSREAVCSDVLTHSILRRTQSTVKIQYLKHRELRRSGQFSRPWLTVSDTGNWLDLLDNRPFSTEFSHTRFLVPSLMEYKGWALFLDSDMLFLSDIQKLFDLADPKYAVMVVKHQHKPKPGSKKMDGREQLSYSKKNWSSFMLFNCGHPSNRALTKELVNFRSGADLHSFCWLRDYEIGELPFTYNYISGVSPRIGSTDGMPSVIHYTEGGCWFEELKDKEIPYMSFWEAEFEDFQRNGHGGFSNVPTTKFEETGP